MRNGTRYTASGIRHLVLFVMAVAAITAAARLNPPINLKIRGYSIIRYIIFFHQKIHHKFSIFPEIINLPPMAKLPGLTVFLLTAIFCLLTSCTSETMPDPRYDFDLQGHRGARGLLPENTIPSFLLAVDLGVNTVEFDVVVTADRRLLVSHEPWFHQNISTKPDGSPVTAEEAMDLNIYRMTSDEVLQYDVGIRGHVNFPDQQPLAVVKPLMADAIEASEAHAAERGIDPVMYN
ncbi:MAG: hypothetical protein LC662_07005, partial [Rhodothermaceae bacterium]|nr:hypothetical protein [Rhodothermaceae bacterium]